MARGFGATYGVANTDRITLSLTAAATQRSWSIWFHRPAAVSGSIGRLFSKGTTTITEQAYWTNDANVIEFNGERATTGGGWNIAAPTNNAWHHLLITYDNSSVSNNPIFYLDGTAVSVTEYATPVGAATTNSEAYTLGNRATDLARIFPGHLAEFAVWDSILTAGNATSLAGKALATTIGSPVCYFRVFGDDSPETDATGNGYTGTVTGTLKTAHPIGVTTQEGYRWRLDDGTETTATWAANQDTGIVAPANSVRRLRLVLDTSGDANAANYQLEYKEANAANWTAIS